MRACERARGVPLNAGIPAGAFASESAASERPRKQRPARAHICARDDKAGPVTRACPVCSCSRARCSSDARCQGAHLALLYAVVERPPVLRPLRPVRPHGPRGLAVARPLSQPEQARTGSRSQRSKYSASHAIADAHGARGHAGARTQGAPDQRAADSQAGQARTAQRRVAGARRRRRRWA